MSLAFLAKKSWHTSNLRNVEKVWIAEQKHAAEEKKLAELKKNIEEERQMQELRKLQAAHGNKSAAVERLDWMYQGPMASSANERTTEEYLLGKEYKANETGTDARKLGDSAYGALALGKPVLPSNDAFSRLNEDPMMLIRSQQKRAQEEILKNPVKMKRIKGDVEKLLKDKKEKKKAKKAKKKERKNGKSKRTRKDSSDSSGSDDSRASQKHSKSRDSRDGRLNNYRRDHDRPSKLDSRRSHSPLTRGDRSPWDRSRSRGRREVRHSRSRDDRRYAQKESSHAHSRIRSSSRSRGRSRRRSRSRSGRLSATAVHPRSANRDSFGREMDRSRSSSPRRRHRGGNHQYSKESFLMVNRKVDRSSREASNRNNDNNVKGQRDSDKRRRSHSASSTNSNHGRRSPPREAAVKAPNDGGKYGLVQSEGAVLSKEVDKSTLGPNTKFLEKAREKKRQEEEEIKRKLTKSRHTSASLTHEEMVKEAARMAEDAKARDVYLAKRAADKRERLEEEEAKLRKDPQFLKKLQDEAYVNGAGSMEERLRRNSHYIQKRAGGG